MSQMCACAMFGSAIRSVFFLACRLFHLFVSAYLYVCIYPQFVDKNLNEQILCVAKKKANDKNKLSVVQPQTE